MGTHAITEFKILDIGEKMFKNSSKKFGRMLIAMIVLAALLIPSISALAFNPDPSTLDIDGSTTLYPFVEASKTQFPVQFPGTIMNVTSTGSGHGQSFILSGQVDIAMSSSNCSNANAGLNGAGPAIYTCAQLTDTIVARDGLSILVNNTSCMATGVNVDVAMTGTGNISRNQIAAIYMGTVTDWSQVYSNCTGVIIPRARIVGSGTRASLIDILKARTPALTDAGEQTTINAVAAPNNIRFTQNSEMEFAISNDATNRMVGYGSLTNVEPNLKALNVEGVVASDANVSNGSYLLGRNLHLYTAPVSGNNKQRIQDYITWILGVRGQSLVDNYGYVKIGTSAPNWDVNIDNVGSVGDLTQIGSKWQQQGPASSDPNNPKVRGWIREDVNFDAAVTVGDLTTVGGHWLQVWP
jgi:phosphate transport system substrate-binding protein